MRLNARSRSAPPVVVVAFLLIGCSGVGDGTGDGSVADSGAPDGGLADAGVADGGGAADGGGSDGGGTIDGGSGSDGGSPGTCGEVTTFEDGLSPTRELHVAEGGSDGADGSAGAPLATVEEALRRATPGTAVRIHAGTYAGGGYANEVRGLPDAPIWVGGAPGEARPVLEGGGNGLQVSRARYLVVHDLEVRGATGNGLNFDDGGDYADPESARHIVFRGLDIHDIGATGNQDCLKLSGLDDFWVLDSSFVRCGGGGSGSGVDMVGCHHGVIARNAFEELSGNAVQAKGGTEDIEIRWNRMIDPGARAVNLGGSTGYTFFRPPLSTGTPNFEARDIRMVANLVVRGDAPAAYVGCDACLVAHNTLVDPQTWVMRILQETVSDATYDFVPSREGRFENNVVYFDSAQLRTFVNVGSNTAPDTFVFANNLWYAHDDPGASAPTLPTPETGGVVGQDPELAGPLAGDGAPSLTSPTRAAGRSGVDDRGDYLGRCWASPPSIGAWEGP